MTDTKFTEMGVLPDLGRRVADLPPRISVVVTAHGRMKYVKGAVESVIHQSLQRSFYEVLVLKDFEDREVDQFLAKAGARIFHDVSGSTIGTLLRGVMESRGDIICFLDDDDTFERDKLRTILQEFQSNPDLGFFHNDFLVVDDQGGPIADAPFHHIRERRCVRMAKGSTKALPLWAMRIGFNASSISVSRRIFADATGAVGSPSGLGPEALLLCLSYKSGLEVVTDPNVLTRYRFHGSWTHVSPSSSDFIGRQVMIDKPYVDLLALIRRMADGTPLVPIVDFELLRWRFHLSLFSLSARWTPSLREIAFFIWGGAARRDTETLYLIAFWGLSLMSRSLAIDIYRKLSTLRRI